jgi:hypothetical protein
MPPPPANFSLPEEAVESPMQSPYPSNISAPVPLIPSSLEVGTHKEKQDGNADETSRRHVLGEGGAGNTADNPRLQRLHKHWDNDPKTTYLYGQVRQSV